jgi:primosomal protein N'
MKKAQRIIYISNQGHFGSTTCSLCNKDVSGNFSKCPHCNAIFTSNDIQTNTGGNDF